MSGTKGHSGRRPRLEEYDIERLVRSSIRIVSMALDDDSPLSMDRKAELASRIVAKRIPQQLQVQINQQLTFDQRMALADKLHAIVLDQSSLDQSSPGQHGSGQSSHGSPVQSKIQSSPVTPIDINKTESGVRGGSDGEVIDPTPVQNP